MPPSQQLPATPELPFLLLLVLLIVANLATADDDTNLFPWLDCPSRTSPSPTRAPPASKNDTFRDNLLALLDTLPAAVAPTGFASMSRGAGGDRAFTRGLCVADLAPSDCARCLDTAVKNATGSCSYGRRAGVWNDRCLLNYADTNTSNPHEESYSTIIYDESTVPDQDGYEKTYNALMSTLPARAAYSSPRMFATGEASYAPPPNGTMYGLVQCMRDRGSPDCERCLQEAVKQIPKCCWGNKGGWVLAYNCYLRFDNESFYDPALDRQPPAAPPPSVPAAYSGDRRRGNKGTRDILAAALTLGIALAVALSLVGIFLQTRGRKAPPTPDNSSNEGVTSIEQVQIDLQVLKTATSNFSEENKLGQGGFGEVFKGKLQDGQEIAVKMLSNDSSQGFDELKNELVLATKLKHRNLVQLLGVCLQEKLLVVYEYMPNRSLDTILFDAEKRLHLDWRKRYMIICGVARGLLYLHEESRLKIIHRDLKPSNILLDEDMNPKISDFGLARAFWGDQSRDVTKRPAGTLGYMAPEYAYCGHVSTKSDIFSFGVIILEMVTGRRNNSALKDANSKNLLSYVWEKWRTKSVAEIVDASLGDQYPQIEMLNCIQIGLLCVQKKPTLRPDTSTVVLMLDSQSTLLQAPSRPAFVTRTSDDAWEGASGSTSVSTRSSINDNLSTAVSENDVTVTQLQPR